MAYVQAQEQAPGLVHPSAALSFGGQGEDKRATQPPSSISVPTRSPVPTSIDRDVSGLVPVRESDENFIRPEILSGPGPMPQYRWPVSPAPEEDAPGDDIMASESEQHHDVAPDAMDGVQQDETSEIETPSDGAISSSPQPDVRMVDADEAQRTPRAIPLSDHSSLDSSNISPESTYEILDKIPKELIASYLRKHSSGTRDETTKPDTSGSKSQNNSHKCQDCDKAFPRLCELK